ncbi:MAG: FAD-dependent oxidoreductase, partial [Dehalococcoidia bacterium]
AAQVVVAAGAWSRQIASAVAGVAGAADLPPMPLRPVKGQILRLRGEPLIRHVVRTPDVYLVPRSDGELVVGGSMEEQGFDGRPTAGVVHDLLREAWRVVPGVGELELVECGVGFRPALRDHLPAIGSLDGRGLYAAVGHFRNGVELAPITARLLADLMCGAQPDPLLAPYDPTRFAAAPSTTGAAR